MYKYTLWKVEDNDDLTEIDSSDLLTYIADIWHDYSNRYTDDEGEYRVIVTNNFINEDLPENFLHLAYLTKTDADFQVSMSLEKVLEAMYNEDLSNEDIDKMSESKDTLLS